MTLNYLVGCKNTNFDFQSQNQSFIWLYTSINLEISFLYDLVSTNPTGTKQSLLILKIFKLVIHLRQSGLKINN